MQALRQLIYVLPYLLGTNASGMLIAVEDAQDGNGRNEEEDEEYMGLVRGYLE